MQETAKALGKVWQKFMASLKQAGHPFAEQKQDWRQRQKRNFAKMAKGEKVFEPFSQTTC